MRFDSTVSLAKFAAVCLAWAAATVCYFRFSELVHHHHFNFESHMQQTEAPNGDDKRHHSHGRGGDFDRIHIIHDKLFFYGLALPIALLTVFGLFIRDTNIEKSGGGTAYTSTKTTTTTSEDGDGIDKSRVLVNTAGEGDVNVKKWTLIWFILPLYLIFLEGARGHGVFHASERQATRHESLYVRLCMSMMSVSGYAATWALALFLIPVTKHSPILDCLRVTPIQALAFHRISGWVGFWNSVLHGFLHLRHLMDVLNRNHGRSNWEQFKWLLVPDEWEKCLATQSPWIFVRGQAPYQGTDAEANQCWLSLVNSTGMVSTLSFALLGLTSMAYFRRRFYAAFYFIHIPAAWLMLITAVWHYPTCALILIPNLVYYLSFNIPVYLDRLGSRWSKKSHALTEAILIPGGCIELTFAAKEEPKRHESSYVHVFCPEVSMISHPFSIFSPACLTDADATPGNHSTKSILLRSESSFTNELKHAILSPPEGQNMPTIQFDSFYAGSFDWIGQAMNTHDKILIFAGGVGITPFLDFLPALQNSIRLRSQQEPYGQTTGPEAIHLHWCTRDMNLASYVWYKYLCHHICTWENDPDCRGKLRIHFHLTRLHSSVEGGEELLEDTGFVSAKTVHVQDSQVLVQDMGRRILPCFLVASGILLHWWWYTQFTISDQYRRNNLVIRSHPVIFSTLLAVVVWAVVKVLHCYKCNQGQYSILSANETNKEASHQEDEETTLVESSVSDSSVSTYNSVGSLKIKINTGDVVTVSGGRPSISCIAHGIVESKKLGVYTCGPQSLLNGVKNIIGKECKNCAFYEEDSEM